MRFFVRASQIALLAGLGIVTSAAWAVDIESFEFNDPNGTVLENAANTANPGNQWSVTNGGADMLPSSVEGGSYRIIKDFNALAENHLDIANITSGTVYLEARMSGWKFTGPDIPDNPEQVRFAFMNSDGTTGNEITAQMQVRRNPNTGGIELRGDAVGTAGSSDITTLAPLNTEQTQPFTMVLALDQESNSYEVFYKDGNAPTQVLGLAGISRVRDANSVRFAVNNNFGSTNLFPTVIDEQFNVDRIAVSDTNPFTDLISLEVDRDTGAMTLINTSGDLISSIQSYSITSEVGAFNTSQWQTVTGNFDSGGDGSFDNEPWMVDTSTAVELGESLQAGGTDGATLGLLQELDLDLDGGSAPGVWLQSPFEDVHMVLNLMGGDQRTIDVNFVGNGGQRWGLGDLDFDNDLDANDWLTFIAGAETDLTGFSIAQAYQSGDLDGDGINSTLDFIIFRDRYETVNGSGSFEQMLATLPEPTSGPMAAFAALMASALLRRRRNGSH